VRRCDADQCKEDDTV